MAAGETKMDIDSMSLERFCMAPRTLQEIIDEFSGMKAVMDELDAFQEHVRKMKDICYHSLHDSYRRGYVDLKNRMDNAQFTENAKQQNKINMLMRQFLGKASELLNRHVNEDVVTAFKAHFEISDDEQKHIFRNGKAKPEILLNYIGDGSRQKHRWAFLRFHQREEGPFAKGEIKDLKKEIQNKQANTTIKVAIPYNSACVLEAYKADQMLKQRREALRDDYQMRANYIIQRVLQNVKNGVLEVCNEHQDNRSQGAQARFMFATRRITRPIRQTTDLKNIPRGTMIGMQQKLQLIDQETNFFYDEDNNPIVINQALRTGTTHLTMHGIPIQANLCALVPYLTPTRLPDYRNQPYKQTEHVPRDLVYEPPIALPPKKRARLYEVTRRLTQ